MLSNAHIDLRNGVAPVLLEQEHFLRAEINARSEHRLRLINDKHTDEELKVTEKEITELLIQHQEVESQIRATSPAYAALTQPPAPFCQRNPDSTP
jgi:hypothetical protein